MHSGKTNRRRFVRVFFRWFWNSQSSFWACLACVTIITLILTQLEPITAAPAWIVWPLLILDCFFLLPVLWWFIVVYIIRP